MSTMKLTRITAKTSSSTTLSTTMRSRHLTGHAVDIAPYVNGEVRWDWPLYEELAPVIKNTAADLGIPIEWGGDWKRFRDGPHWQLPRRQYPAEE